MASIPRYGLPSLTTLSSRGAGKVDTIVGCDEEIISLRCHANNTYNKSPKDYFFFLLRQPMNLKYILCYVSRVNTHQNAAFGFHRHDPRLQAQP